MKLFMVEVHFKRRRRSRYGVELIVHASSTSKAEKYIEGKYPGCKIVSAIELRGTDVKHFVVADLVVD